MFLSMKSLLTIILFISSLITVGQENSITIRKKKKPEPEKGLYGLYYSTPIVQEYENKMGGHSYKDSRYYMWIEDKKIYITTSPLSPNKFSNKLSKKGNSLATEIGDYSYSDFSLYITSIPTNRAIGATYRYVGEFSDSIIYLSYKAANRQKLALDLYLYQYNEE